MPIFTIKDADETMIAQDEYLPRVLRAWRRLPAGTPMTFHIDERLIFTITPEEAIIEPDTKDDLFKMLYASQ